MSRYISLFFCLCFAFSGTAFEVPKDFNKHLSLPFAYTQNNSENLAELQQSTPLWQPVPSGFLQLSHTMQTIWLRVPLSNSSDLNLPLLLSIHNNQLDEVSAFVPKENRSILVPPSPYQFVDEQRPILHEAQLVPLQLPAQQHTVIYIRVKNSEQTYLPLSLWHPIEYLKYTSKFNLLYGILAGLILAMVLTNAAMYSFTHKHYFLYGGLTIAAIWLLNVHLYGFSHRYIYGDWLWLQQYGQTLFMLLSTWLFIPLLKTTLVPKSAVRIQRALNILFQLSIVIAIGLSLFPHRIALPIAFAYCFALAITYMLIAVAAWQRDAFSHKTYLLLFLLLFMVLSYQCAFELSLLSGAVLDRPLTYVCYLLISLAISYALARRYIQDRDDKIKQQQARLAQTRAEDALLKERIHLQAQAQEELESSIDERTFELEVTLRELEEKNRELEKLNMEDALTKVKNRRYFDKRVIMEVRRSRREQTTLSVVMLDIDHFKQINDNYGHVVGDQAICAVAKMIEQHLKRPSDEVFRYGGEEFVLLLPNTQEQGAKELAEQIREDLSQVQFDFGTAQLSMTLSAGIYSAIASDSKNPTIFTDLADKALYQAKQQGRNRVIAYK
ncbi:sensor domain-containing diguanylate cyclase [Pseudoalteromonas byunsanensis]|uniref:diguanylate cyclase n=1 Tax=Pseudoalteromonas byunsanensis TaxID=327939 RepID=A0A1S1NDF5_9GAMM|nr:diguanylate cyclase [Pseudoalteromonas byunsanensis]OHU97524.1 sensor domain-containing diguanylate cyclase [Pseudoalteromonas byunsanensis]